MKEIGLEGLEAIDPAHRKIRFDEKENCWKLSIVGDYKEFVLNRFVVDYLRKSNTKFLITGEKNGVEELLYITSTLEVANHVKKILDKIYDIVEITAKTPAFPEYSFIRGLDESYQEKKQENT